MCVEPDGSRYATARVVRRTRQTDTMNWDYRRRCLSPVFAVPVTFGYCLYLWAVAVRRCFVRFRVLVLMEGLIVCCLVFCVPETLAAARSRLNYSPKCYLLERGTTRGDIDLHEPPQPAAKGRPQSRIRVGSTRPTDPR